MNVTKRKAPSSERSFVVSSNCLLCLASHNTTLWQLLQSNETLPDAHIEPIWDKCSHVEPVRVHVAPVWCTIAHGRAIVRYSPGVLQNLPLIVYSMFARPKSLAVTFDEHAGWPLKINPTFTYPPLPFPLPLPTPSPPLSSTQNPCPTPHLKITVPSFSLPIIPPLSPSRRLSFTLCSPSSLSFSPSPISLPFYNSSTFPSVSALFSTCCSSFTS